MADSDETTAHIDHSTRATELVSIFKALAALPNTHIDEAWAKLLDAPRSSEDFYAAIGAISRSLATLKAEISGSHLREASKETYLAAVDSLAQYVAVHRMRNLTTDGVKSELDAFRLLTLLDDVLIPTANRVVTNSTLVKWLESVQELIEGAKQAISDPVLRDFVIRQLTQLQWAIQNYKWLGIDGISRSYGAMAAELARSTGMKGAQTPEARNWFQRVKKPIVNLGIGIAAVSVVVEKADNLVTHGGHIYEVITDQASEKPKEDKSAGTALVSSKNVIQT